MQAQKEKAQTSKKTVIIGATNNPARYAYLAAERLTAHNHPIVPVGIKKGEVFGEQIQDLRRLPPVEGVDTVTLYVNPVNQKEWEDYIVDLKPARIIFNPGTENPTLQAKAKAAGIETLQACTLVMLSTGLY